jgi:predicted nucleic acid-binding protein
MSYLLDTNVISEIRKPKADHNVQIWLSTVRGTDLFLSVLVLGEIRQGIERLRPRDPRRAAVFEGWLAKLRRDHADRIVAVSDEVAEEWGRMNAMQPLPVVDALMAATAKTRGWTYVTRNTRHVERTGARLLNPFAPR